MTRPLNAVTTAPALTEKQFMRQVRDLADTFGWAYYHPFLSLHSPRGWPDVALCRPPRLVLAELKTDANSSQPTPDQQRWLDLLGRCATAAWAADANWPPSERAGLEVYLWRPADWDQIVRILR